MDYLVIPRPLGLNFMAPEGLLYPPSHQTQFVTNRLIVNKRFFSFCFCMYFSFAAIFSFIQIDLQS